MPTAEAPFTGVPRRYRNSAMHSREGASQSSEQRNDHRAGRDRIAVDAQQLFALSRRLFAASKRLLAAWRRLLTSSRRGASFCRDYLMRPHGEDIARHGRSGRRHDDFNPFPINSNLSAGTFSFSNALVTAFPGPPVASASHFTASNTFRGHIANRGRASRHSGRRAERPSRPIPFRHSHAHLDVYHAERTACGPRQSPSCPVGPRHAR